MKTFVKNILKNVFMNIYQTIGGKSPLKEKILFFFWKII